MICPSRRYRIVTTLSAKWTLRFRLMLLFILLAARTMAAADNDSGNARFITQFPFAMLSGGVIIISAGLDDFGDSLHFILDTGSGGISLDSMLTERLHLPRVPTTHMLKGLADARRISYVMDRTLRLPGLNVEHLNFHLNDYDLLSSIYGLRIDGIIGYSFLKQFIVKIDYDNNLIQVWSQGKIKYPRGGYMLRPAINGIPTFEATITDGRECTDKFYFDSGAGLSLLMSEDFQGDSSIFAPGKKTIVTQAEGVGGKKVMQLTVIKRIQIGPYKFRRVPAHVFKDDFNVTDYPNLGGLIGNDLLRRFNVTLNYENNEIHLKPNSHFSDAFDYSYVGMGIYLAEDGHIVIDDVLPGSPAEAVGIKGGDVLIAINNLFGGTIQQYKEVLQQTGATLRLTVMRNGQPESFKLKVKSILRVTRK